MFQKSLTETRRIYKEHFAFQQEMRIVKKQSIYVPQLKKKLTPAVCADMYEELDRLYILRRDLYFQYKLLEDKIVLGNNPSQYKKDFERVVEEINKTQDTIDAIHEYYDSTHIDIDDTEIQKEKTRLAKLKEQENSKLYAKGMKKLLDLEKVTLTRPGPPDYVVYSVPKTESGEIKDEPVPVPAPKPKKSKVVNLTESDKKIIKKNIKELIKEKFKAKTLEECASQKRSQPYYMKKEDILKTIEENPDIKQVLPANYKSLSKENLCEHLFG